MRVRVDKLWKAAPLPALFHAALEAGDWQRALHIYQRHPFHSPPADTFDLLKSVMHSTGVGVNDVKRRFNEKVRLSAILQRKAPEEVEWGAFWSALNTGDSKTISAGITGAAVSSTQPQIAVAEACAVLLKGVGVEWQQKIVEDMPFATVTRSNLVHVALSMRRWDVATEFLRHMRLTQADLSTLWPLMRQFTWQQVLGMISACPKNSVPYDAVLPFILHQGCDLQTLSEHLEQARVLGDVDVVAPLLTYAVEAEDWAFVERAVEHLVDIGQVTGTARKAFAHLCQLHTPRKVCHSLQEHQIPLAKMTIESLEALKL